ncbi:putative S-layer protein [Nanoarchaeota archaeon]
MRYLSIFIGVFLIAFAGLALADSNLNITMATTALTGLHNADVTGSFSLANLNPSDSITNLSCTMTGENWNITCSPSTLVANATQSVNLNVHVPQFEDQGLHSLTLSLTGKLLSTGATVSDTQVFSVTLAASPSYSIDWITGAANLYQTQNRSLEFNITNTGNVLLSSNAVLDLSAFNESTSYNQNFTLNPGVSRTGTAKLVTTDNTDVGEKTITLSVLGVYNNTLNITSPSSQFFEVIYPYCEDIELGNLTSTPISIYQIKNQNDVENEDFAPLEIIELDVKISNTDDDDNIKVIAEAVLVYEDGEVDDADDKVKIKINDDSKETITLEIEVPADIEEGTHYLYLRVDNDETSGNCQQRYFKLDIEKSTREVVPKDVEYDAAPICGGTMSFSGEIINIGSNDEEQVKVVLEAFDQTFDEIYKDLDEGDDSGIFTFNINVPEDVEGTNKIKLTLSYDYDEDDEKYDEKEFFSYSPVVSCKLEDVSFTTETSVATVDKESDVRVLVKNPSKTSKTYTFAATASWAEVKSVQPSSLTLTAGEEKYVTVKLQPNEDVSGSHDLSFKATYDGKTEVLNVPVTVQEPSKSNIFSKIGDQYKNNTTWAIINTVLVLAIVAVILLIFTGRNKPNFSQLLGSLKQDQK